VFGVEHQLRYGLNCPIEDDVIEFTLQQPFGDLAAVHVPAGAPGRHPARRQPRAHPPAVPGAGRAGRDPAVVGSGDPLVFNDTLTHADGRRFAWFVSQHPTEQTVLPRLDGAAGLFDLADGDRVEKVTLPGYGVRVLELRARSA
jgi:hypothetical protein